MKKSSIFLAFLFVFGGIAALSPVANAQSYCTPSLPISCGSGDYIQSFSTTGGSTNITNNNTACTGNAYVDYSATQIHSGVQGNTVNFSFTNCPNWPEGYKIWVDWNGNGDFTDPGEEVYASVTTVSGGGTITGSFGIPSTALPGTTRLRIRCVYYSTLFTPCSSESFGETEDYGFTVIAAQPCTAATFPSFVDASVDHDTICVAGKVNLDLDTLFTFSGVTYQWQSAPSASGPWVNVAAGQLTPPIQVADIMTDTWYRCQVLCEGSSALTSDVIAVKVADPALLSTKDSFHCDPGSVTLLATASPNSEVRWYDEPGIGGLPIGTGSPFQTPFLTQTDTFYVAAGVGSAPSTPAFVGNGSAMTSSSFSPFYQLFETSKVQMLFTAAELHAAGFDAGTITKIGFKIGGASGINTYENLNIKMKNTTVTSLTTSWETGLTTVYTNPAFDIQANMVNEFQLTYPFPWDGNSNIIIEVCYASSDWGSTPSQEYTSGLPFTATHYNYEDNNLNHCTSPTGWDYTTTSRVNVQFTIKAGCETPRQPVIARIYPNPDIDLGDNINECIDSGQAVVLDAGLPPYNPQYLWEDGSTNQVRAVNTSGTYSVAVTNSFGCVGRDTIGIVLRNNPIVELGGDTSVCEGVIVTLDAGDDGIEYFWNTGETTQQINVDASGSYAVLVTNDQGCIKADTVNVTMSGLLPSIDYILPTNNGSYTFTYTAVNPQNVNGYEWDFGDGSPVSYAQSPTHTYAAAGNYIVTLKVSSDCGFIYDSTAAHIVGIDAFAGNDRQLLIYPNPAHSTGVIRAAGALKMEQITVYDVVGRVLRQVQPDNPKQHVLHLDGFAAGLYSIKIVTDHGTITKKLEIIK